MPNFHDLPDGSSSINHTGEDFWVEGDYMSETSFTAEPPLPAPIRPRTFPPNAGETVRRPQTATEVNEARRRVNPEWRPIPARPRVEDLERRSAPRPVAEMLREAIYEDNPIARTERRPRARRRGLSDPDAAIRKDPNAWSIKEAIELCKLLEVVLPEAGFHIALTGGLLYKEGRRKDCDLMFYQIRGTEPNYEVLWKYLTVAGVIRSPSYPENGWLVKATYRGKAVDCLFPNAKKSKKVGGIPYPVIPPTSLNTAAGSVAYPVPPPLPPTLVRHNDGTPEFVAPILYHRSPSAPLPYDPAELLATPAPAPVPAAEAQYDIPF